MPPSLPPSHHGYAAARRLGEAGAGGDQDGGGSWVALGPGAAAELFRAACAMQVCGRAVGWGAFKQGQSQGRVWGRVWGREAVEALAAGGTLCFLSV